MMRAETEQIGPRISVVMIFLNEQEFIREAIESVFSQTYTSWELLLVDDGSSDASTAIAREYATAFPEAVRHLEHDDHQNRGMSASRNLGISQAAGTYISFLDGDDVYLPQKLERQLGILEAQPSAAMVYGSTLRWFSWTGKSEDARRDSYRMLGVRPDSLVEPPALATRILARSAEPPATCGVLIRRQILLDVGGFDERFRGLFEDQVCFFKICLQYPVFVESGSWDRYRRHPQGFVQRARQSGQYHQFHPNPAHCDFITWLHAYIVQQGIDDPELLRWLRQRMFPYRYPRLYRVVRGMNDLRFSTMALVRRCKRALASIGHRGSAHV